MQVGCKVEVELWDLMEVFTAAGIGVGECRKVA